MEPRLGIISPDGCFYPCGYGCHEFLCKSICIPLGFRIVFDLLEWDPDNDETLHCTYADTLYHKHYVSVSCQSDGMPLVYSKNKPNSKQQEIIDKLVEEFQFLNAEEYQTAVYDNREGNVNNSYVVPSVHDIEKIKQRWMQEHSEYQIIPCKLVIPYMNVSSTKEF